MDCVHRPQNAQSATVVLVAELVATRREERPLWICAPMIHSTAIALSPSPTERALVQVAPHPKCPTAPGKRKESVCFTEIFESENGGLALHQANGLGRKRNLRHNTSHKRNLRHNTSHTQADDHTIRLWSLLVGGRTLPTAPLYLSQAVCNVLGRKPVSYSVPRLVPQSRTV
jgi:hypothetical protein